MFVKAIVVFCVQSLLVQGIYSQCLPGPFVDDYALSRFGPGVAPLGYGPYPSNGCPGAVAPTSGGGFPVTSSSPIAPTGITVLSENAIDGVLSVIGELPFLGAVALDGSLPTVGAGGINYGCGNGNVAIISEGLAPAAPAGPAYPAGLGYGPGLAGPAMGYGPGLTGPGIGYGPGVGGFGYGGPSYGLGYGGFY